MLTIHAGKSGKADFLTLNEALQAVPYETPATIKLEAGIFEEKIFCDKKHIVLQGNGQGQTIIRWHDAGRHPHADGRPTHTFRSYTAFFSGEYVQLENLTIENTAGEGANVGQAIAAYMDSNMVYCRNVGFTGSQDTLFCAPLPEKEREPDGFLGPRVFTKRNITRQYYKNCYISGDVDFIFGGANAVFDTCEIYQRASKAGGGYACAPCTPQDELGFVFTNCSFTGDAAPASCWLGRPWRPYGKAILLNCQLGAQVTPEGWDDWYSPQNRETAYFAEYQSTGAGQAVRPAWVHSLTPQQAEAFVQQAEMLKQQVLALKL